MGLTEQLFVGVMDSPGPSAFPYQDDRLVVCCLGSDAVQTANRSIEDAFRQVMTANRAATSAPPITEMFSVQDRKTKSMHLLLVYRLDYRRRRSAAIGDVVVFSKPCHAPFRTKELQLATPAYYRENEDLELGIRDVHEGTLTKDATRWANTLVAEGAVQSVEIKFRSSREPWVYCASHYQLNRELRRLKDHFDEKHGYTAATRIRDPNAFATWLGINFALNLDKTTHVKLGVHDKGGYALSLYNTSLWQGSGPIDTCVQVYHGPVHYEDSTGRIATQEDWFDPCAGPKAWFTKKMCFETQSEYRFAVSTIGDPVEPRHYIPVSPELRGLSSAL